MIQVRFSEKKSLCNITCLTYYTIFIVPETISRIDHIWNIPNIDVTKNIRDLHYNVNCVSVTNYGRPSVSSKSFVVCSISHLCTLVRTRYRLQFGRKFLKQIISLNLTYGWERPNGLLSICTVSPIM